MIQPVQKLPLLVVTNYSDLKNTNGGNSHAPWLSATAPRAVVGGVLSIGKALGRVLRAFMAVRLLRGKGVHWGRGQWAQVLHGQRPTPAARDDIGLPVLVGSLIL